MSCDIDGEDSAGAGVVGMMVTMSPDIGNEQLPSANTDLRFREVRERYFGSSKNSIDPKNILDLDYSHPRLSSERKEAQFLGSCVMMF